VCVFITVFITEESKHNDNFQDFFRPHYLENVFNKDIVEEVVYFADVSRRKFCM
jgi:hypothetical protein